MLKYLILLSFCSNLVAGEKSSFKDDIQPYLEVATSYHLLIKGLEFYPDIIATKNMDEERVVTLLAAMKQDEESNRAFPWNYYVDIHLKEDSKGNRYIGNIVFKDCNRHSTICWLTPNVYRMDNKGKLQEQASAVMKLNIDELELHIEGSGKGE